MTGRPASPPHAAEPGAEGAALLEALRTLLLPLARLAVARGLPVRDVEEQLRGAFVAAAREAQPAGAPARQVSRIATATGLTRREVTRLLGVPRDAATPRRSPATELFARWLAEPSLRDARGRPRPLPRQGAEGSFEALARSVTRDVHPRSLLDELCRLGLAQVDGDTVQLTHESFVPKDDRDRMLGFLGANVGDHLRAAVGNVLSTEPLHLEQAMFADELSRDSMEEIDAFVRTQWKALIAATVPRVNQQIEADRAGDRPGDQRVRIGMYMYSTKMIDVPNDAPSADAPAPAFAPAAEPKRPARRGR